MRKYIAPILAVMFLVIAGKAFAVSHEAIHVNEGESYFEKVGSAGNNQPGNAGYFVLTGRDGVDAVINYYLWVAPGGQLMIASYPTISARASFPSGDWRNIGAGVAVGAQTQP